MPQRREPAQLPGRLPPAAREVPPRQAQDLHRPRRRRRQDLPDARGRARPPEAGRRTSSSASSRRTAAPRPRAASTDLEVVPRRSVRLQGQDPRGDGSARDPRSASPRSCSSTSSRTRTSPAPRTTKRYQDVEDLLAAGISVMTTVNIQHFESVQDIVSRVTGVDVQERVPDRVLRQADAIVNVDLPVRGAARAPEGRKDLSRGADRAGARELLPRREPRVAARARDAPDRRPPGGRAAGTGPVRRDRAGRHEGDGRDVVELARRPGCSCAGRPPSPGSSTRTGSRSTCGPSATARSGMSAREHRLLVGERARSPWSSARRSCGSPAENVAAELLRFAREHGITLAIFGKSRRPVVASLSRAAAPSRPSPGPARASTSTRSRPRAGRTCAR